MKILNKLLICLLSVALILGATGCGQKTEEQTQPAEETTASSSESPARQDAPRGTQRMEMLRIVYASDQEAPVKESALLLGNLIRIQADKSPQIYESQYSPKDQKPAIYLERVSENATEHSYTVEAIDGGVSIRATNAFLYEEAIRYFFSVCDWEEDTLVYDGDMHYESEVYACRDIVSGDAMPTIVFSAELSGGVSLASQIKNAIREATGKTLNVKAEGEAPSGAKIFVGKTEKNANVRNGSILVRDGNVYLGGNVSSSVERFCALAKSFGQTDGLSLPEILLGEFAGEGYAYAPSVEGELLQITDSDMHSYFSLYQNATMQTYLLYKKQLQKKHFLLYTERTVNGNRFATYTDGQNVLSVSFIPEYGYVRVAAETVEHTVLPDLEKQEYKEVTTPQLTQINGACAFILRLSDGRFILVDGGLNREVIYTRIYEQLVAQNVLGGKPVIAAWFLSHAHSDHFGGFVGFADAYGTRVTLEQVVVNIPSEQTYLPDTSSTTAMKNNISYFKQRIEQIYRNTQVVVAHAGMISWYADAMVDVLYTQEDLAPNAMTNTNSSSLIYTVTLGGKRMVFLGDSHNDTSRIIYEMYGKTLKSDIVQIAHHGYNGGDKNMYASIAADTALWTNPYETVVAESLWNATRNNFDIKSVKENLMMSNNSAMIMPLPHEVGDLPQYARTFS